MLAALLLGAASLEAQQRRPPVPVPPTVPPVVDSLRRARADSLRADSVARARRAAGDTTRRAPSDTGRAAASDTLRKRDRTDSLGRIIPDSATLRLRDSLLAVLRGDTLRTSYTRAELPVGLERDRRLTWTREQAAELGAVTLIDLLERVPGVTTYRAGWLGGITSAAYNGDVSRVRIFLDGVALDATDMRAGGVLDLTDIPIWLMEDITVERGAAEVRVWLRSWSQRSTVPYTRVEVNSGDLQTNRFAGAFGKRFKNGAGFQVAAQQMSTSGGRSPIGTGRGAGDGSHQQVFARFGWARKWLSIDGLTMGSIRVRDSLVRTGDTLAALPRFDGQRRDAYVRVGFRDPDADGLWAQMVGGTLRTSMVQNVIERAEGDTTRRPAVPDSSRWTTQLVSTVGYNMGALRFSAVQRGRVFRGRRTYSPAVRVSFDTPRLSLVGYAERSRPDSSERVEVAARVSPMSWLVLNGAVGAVAMRSNPFGVDTFRISTDTALQRRRFPTIAQRGLAFRGDVNLRLGTTWLTGGVMRLADTSSLLSPRLLGDTAFRTFALPNTGVFARVETPVWKAIRFNGSATRWLSGQLYRPQTHTRAELFVQTRWLRRFPAGDFGFNTRIVHEYRSRLDFVDSVGVIGEITTRAALANQALSFLLELRLKTAVLGWGYRFSGNPGYQHIPGVPMPRPLQYYGVRWDFWN